MVGPSIVRQRLPPLGINPNPNPNPNPNHSTVRQRLPPHGLRLLAADDIVECQPSLHTRLGVGLGGRVGWEGGRVGGREGGRGGEGGRLVLHVARALTLTLTLIRGAWFCTSLEL